MALALGAHRACALAAAAPAQDWPYGDGSHPPENVIEAFFNLTREVFVHLIKPAKQKVSLRERAYSTGSRGRPSSTPPTPQPKAGPIALHCVSGLGR